MQIRHYMAMDVHSSHTVLEVQTPRGRVVERRDLDTRARTLIDAVKVVRGPRGLVIEEGNMADWAYRTLLPYVDEIIVCDPRRNRLIVEGDKDDSVDPGKLCELYRLGGLRAVHHPRQRRALDLKRWVWLYQDQVELMVAAKNKIKAAYRYNGVRYGRRDVYRPAERETYLTQLPTRAARRQMEQLYRNLDYLEQGYWELKYRLNRLAKRHPVVKTFLKIPGYGPIYALTFYVVVDTPWRFQTVRKLWAYAGLGIQRHKSGLPRPGKPQSNGPEHLNRPCNFRLKDVAKGVATVAITKASSNPFSKTFERLVSQGIPQANAKLTVARKALQVPWAMWKRGEAYRPVAS
jgi:transposase